MATTSSRSRLINQLSRKGRSSPSEGEYTTASSFDAARDAIHSTVQLGENTNTQQSLPSYPHQHRQSPINNFLPDHVSLSGSEGSAEMSIELGRSLKQGTRDHDSSANFLFDAGDGSMYGVTGTPPLRAMDNQRKNTNGLRRQASLRSANESAKTNVALNMKQRSLSAALKQIGAEDESSFLVENTTQNSSTFNARNTRFTRSREASVKGSAVPATSRVASAPAQQTSHKTGGNNQTGQSNSFALPEMPNINDLVTLRKDGTQAMNRNIKAHSRFTSAPTKLHGQRYDRVKNVPVPDDEEAIFTSLYTLKDRVEQLEREKSESQIRAEEYESEIIDLRSQLTVIQRRSSDSPLGSDDDTSGRERWKKEKKSLQASVQSLQERLNRSERQVSVSEITVKRVTKERDSLLTEVGSSYYSNEELKAENSAFRESHNSLESENQELKDEVDALRKENQELRLVMAQTQTSYEQDALQREKRESELKNLLAKKVKNSQNGRDITSEVRQAKDLSQTQQDTAIKSRKEGMGIRSSRRTERPKSASALDEATNDSLATMIQHEVAKHREAAAAKAPVPTHKRATPQQQTATSGPHQGLSGSERKTSVPKRPVSAPLLADGSDAESTTQLDFSQYSQDASKKISQPTKGRSRPRPALPKHLKEDSRDLTMLSWQDPEELANLRKKLEREYRSGQLDSNYAASVEGDDTQQSSRSFKQFQADLKSGKLRKDCEAEVAKQQATAQQTASTVPRKSSMKDVNSGIDDGIGRLGMGGTNLNNFTKVVKSVRVISPHTSDGSVNPPQQGEHDDTSIHSNTSRPRRRAASAEAITSAFIVPDITIDSFTNISQAGGDTDIRYGPYDCPSCGVGKDQDAGVPASAPVVDCDATASGPIPVTDREDPDVTNATIRPAQPPPVALASVIKQLEREIKELKTKLAAQQRLYNQHDPALSKHRRMDVKTLMERLTADIEKRSDQVYQLYDVLEGQKQAGALAKKAGEAPKSMTAQEVDETLSSIGIDPAELSGRVGRSAGAPFGLDGMNETSDDESGELPWDGLSEEEY